MQHHDPADTLHFVDPPYVFGTRSLRNVTQGCYRHEMTDEQHIELLGVLRGLRGMVVLSGDRKSTRLNSSHGYISYAVFCLKKKNNTLVSTYTQYRYQ